MEVEAEKSGQPVLPPPSSPKDNERTGIADAGDAERLLVAETSVSQRVDNVQPLATLVMPLSPGAAHAPSPEPRGTSPEPLESYPPVLADAGNRSMGVGAPRSGTLLEFSNRLGEASTIVRPDGHNVSDTRKPPILAPSSANKFESLVLLDKHTTIHDSLLKCTPYIINLKYKVHICTDCRYCIIPNRALEHLRHEHPHCKVETTFSAHLHKRFPDLVSEAIHPPETIEAVFGLAIPAKKYTICSCCRRGYIDVPSWQHHVCRNAGTALAGQRPHFRSHVQTFSVVRESVTFLLSSRIQHQMEIMGTTSTYSR